MNSTPWDTCLEDATTPTAVIAVCDRFVTGCSFQELGQLPASCQPKHGVEESEVKPYAARLLERLGERGESASPILRRMAEFFDKAAARLAQLAETQSALHDQVKPAAFPYQ